MEECREKCSAYDKKLSTKGRQEFFQDAITSIVNLLVYFEFIFYKMQSSKIPALIVLLKGIGRMLTTPTFRTTQKRMNKQCHGQHTH